MTGADAANRDLDGPKNVEMPPDEARAVRAALAALSWAASDESAALAHSADHLIKRTGPTWRGVLTAGVGGQS